MDQIIRQTCGRDFLSLLSPGTSMISMLMSQITHTQRHRCYTQRRDSVTQPTCIYASSSSSRYPDEESEEMNTEMKWTIANLMIIVGSVVCA